jgi:hypothetical protein
MVVVSWVMLKLRAKVSFLRLHCGSDQISEIFAKKCYSNAQWSKSPQCTIPGCTFKICAKDTDVVDRL